MSNKIQQKIIPARIIMLLSILAFIFILFLTIIITAIPPASGYELSIYDAYPWYFWFFLLSALFLGIFIILSPLIFTYHNKNYLIGLFIVILCNSLFLSLPFFRGYGFFPSGDALTHVGYIKDIQLTGYLSENNFYPIVHIIGIDIAKITNLPINIVANILWICWSAMFFLNMCILSRIITPDIKNALCIIVLSSPLIFSYFHPLIHPSILAIFLIPLFLYLYFKIEKNKKKMHTILLLNITSFTLVFTHPTSSLFAILILIFLPFSIFLIKKIVKNLSIKIIDIPQKRNFNLLLIMIITYFTWYLAFTRINKSITTILTFFGNEQKEALFESTLGILNITNLNFFQIFSIFIFRYGSIFIILFLTIVAILFLFKKIINKEQINLRIIDFTLIFIIGFIFSLFFLFGYFIEFDLIRISRYFLLIYPILLGLIFYQLLYKSSKKQRKKIYIATLFFIICIIISLNIFNVYGSKLVVRSNLQVTKMNIEGADWFLNYQNNTILTNSIGIDIPRYEHFVFGVDNIPPVKKTSLNKNPVPTHFGYDNNNNSIRLTFANQSQYILIVKQGVISVNIIPENARSRVFQYTTEDFKRLNNDSYATLIYNNGEFEIWNIYAE